MTEDRKRRRVHQRARSGILWGLEMLWKEDYSSENVEHDCGGDCPLRTKQGRVECSVFFGPWFLVVSGCVFAADQLVFNLVGRAVAERRVGCLIAGSVSIHEATSHQRILVEELGSHDAPTRADDPGRKPRRNCHHTRACYVSRLSRWSMAARRCGWWSGIGRRACRTWWPGRGCA